MNRMRQGSKGKASFFALLAVISIFACVTVSALGDFIVWIFGGVATYSLFLAVYLLIPRHGEQFAKVRYDPRPAETRGHITFHRPLLAGIFALAILLVLVILLLAL